PRRAEAGVPLDADERGDPGRYLGRDRRVKVGREHEHIRTRGRDRCPKAEADKKVSHGRLLWKRVWSLAPGLRAAVDLPRTTPVAVPGVAEGVPEGPGPGAVVVQDRQRAQGSPVFEGFEPRQEPVPTRKLPGYLVPANSREEPHRSCLLCEEAV